MTRYVEMLRRSPARDDLHVMAPGDREWKVAQERERNGVDLDPITAQSFVALAERYAVTLPFAP
jgi:LDH2 family malate/lactate/ureidoglycolate dehydrogenase